MWTILAKRRLRRGGCAGAGARVRRGRSGRNSSTQSDGSAVAAGPARPPASTTRASPASVRCIDGADVLLVDAHAERRSWRTARRGRRRGTRPARLLARGDGPSPRGSGRPAVGGRSGRSRARSIKRQRRLLGLSGGWCSTRRAGVVDHAEQGVEDLTVAPLGVGHVLDREVQVGDGRTRARATDDRVVQVELACDVARRTVSGAVAVSASTGGVPTHRGARGRTSSR